MGVAVGASLLWFTGCQSGANVGYTSPTPGGYTTQTAPAQSTQPSTGMQLAQMALQLATQLLPLLLTQQGGGSYAPAYQTQPAPPSQTLQQVSRGIQTATQVASQAAQVANQAAQVAGQVKQTAQLARTATPQPAATQPTNPLLNPVVLQQLLQVVAGSGGATTSPQSAPQTYPQR